MEPLLSCEVNRIRKNLEDLRAEAKLAFEDLSKAHGAEVHSAREACQKARFDAKNVSRELDAVREELHEERAKGSVRDPIGAAEEKLRPT